MRILDVTVPIAGDIPVFPGDPPVHIERLSSADSHKASFALSLFSFGSHTGTHVDPPSHLIEGGASVDSLPLDVLTGPARVVEVSDRVIDETALRRFDLSGDRRVLFKTRNSELWSRREFVEDYVYMTADAARILVEQGVKLVGVDYLSVDPPGACETHLTLLSAGVIIVESLDLRSVESGQYEILCLPLRVRDGDGAPARVLLRH